MKTNLSIWEITKLDYSSDIKDELLLGVVNGVNLLRYVDMKGITSEVLRAIRLCLKHGVSPKIIENNLTVEVLSELVRLYSVGYNLRTAQLDRYFTPDLTIPVDTLRLLINLSLRNVDFSDIDFGWVDEKSAEIVVEALLTGVDVNPILNSDSSSDLDVFKLLVELSKAGLDVNPFLQGVWSKEQIATIIRSRSIIPSLKLVSEYINPNFTSGQIEYIVKAYELGNRTCFDYLTSQDNYGDPIYNEYQMFNILEGAKYGLDFQKYADPNNSDMVMSSIRNQLFKEKDNELGGRLSAQIKGVTVRLST